MSILVVAFGILLPPWEFFSSLVKAGWQSTCLKDRNYNLHLFLHVLRLILIMTGKLLQHILYVAAPCL